MQSNRVRMVQIGWLENRIADLWPLHNTADIAAELLVSEARIANALAHMRDRNDSRLRRPAVFGFRSPGIDALSLPITAWRCSDHVASD